MSDTKWSDSDSIRRDAFHMTKAALSYFSKYSATAEDMEKAIDLMDKAILMLTEAIEAKDEGR